MPEIAEATRVSTMNNIRRNRMTSELDALPDALEVLLYGVEVEEVDHGLDLADQDATRVEGCLFKIEGSDPGGDEIRIQVDGTTLEADIFKEYTRGLVGASTDA